MGDIVIGKVEENQVEIDASLVAMGVKETVTYDEIVKIISESRQYVEARDTHVINHMVDIITWEEAREYRGITYTAKLVRSFSVGYNQHMNDKRYPKSDQRVRITESNHFTMFKMEFTGVSEIVNKYQWSELAKTRGQTLAYIQTTGKDLKLVDRNMRAQLDHIIDVQLPTFVSGIDQEIERLTQLKNTFTSAYLPLNK